MYPTDAIAMKAQNVPTQASDVDLLFRTLANARGLIARVNNLTDYLIGEVPESSTTPDVPDRPGTLGNLVLVSGEVDVLIERLHQRLTALEARLGVC